MEVGRFDLCALFSLQLHHYRVAFPSTIRCSVYWRNSIPLAGLRYFAYCWNDAVSSQWRAPPVHPPVAQQSRLQQPNRLPRRRRPSLASDRHFMSQERGPQNDRTAQRRLPFGQSPTGGFCNRLFQAGSDDFRNWTRLRSATAEWKERSVHLLQLHVVGDFDSLWDIVKGFSDYLIIEDATNNKDGHYRRKTRFYRRPQFSTNKGASNCPGLEGIDSVLVWKSSADALVADWFPVSGNEFVFEHLQIRSSLSKAIL